MTDRLEDIRAWAESWRLPLHGGPVPEWVAAILWLIDEVDALRADNTEAHADKEFWYEEAERLRAVKVLADAWRDARIERIAAEKAWRGIQSDEKYRAYLAAQSAEAAAAVAYREATR